MSFLNCYLTAPRPLSKGQAHSPDVNHCALVISTRSLPGASQRVRVIKPGRAPSGVIH